MGAEGFVLAVDGPGGREEAGGEGVHGDGNYDPVRAIGSHGQGAMLANPGEAG